MTKMQKQVSYPSLIFRLLSTCLDLIILSAVTDILFRVLMFTRLISTEDKLFGFIMSITAMAAYFILFWKYKSATPGKMLIKAKIVDAETRGKPSTSQLIGRFFSYPTFFFGIWSIPFTKKSQALHDKMSGTTVISV